MLYNVVFGNQEKMKHNDWRVITDGKGGREFYHLDNRAIRARIRVEPSVDERVLTGKNTPKLDLLWKSSNISVYSTDPNQHWRNNTSNLNPILRPFTNKEIEKEDGDTELYMVYVTLMNNYSVMSVTTPYEIRHTYHQKGEYQGCVVVFTEKDLKEQKSASIITFDVYDKKRESYCKLSVQFGRTTVGISETSASGKQDKRFNKKKSTKDKDNKKKPQSFIDTTKMYTKVTVTGDKNSIDDPKFTGLRCKVDPHTWLTSTYLVTPDFREMIDKIIRYKNKNIVVIDPNTLSDPETKQKIIAETLEKHIRAVTVVGMDLPADIIHSAKLLFIFRYDATRKRLICQKSN